MAKPAPGHPPDTNTSREERTQPGGGGGGIPHHRPGAGPPLLPGPLAPPRVALRRGRRPPARPPAGAALPGPAWPRGGAGGWGRACGPTLRPRCPRGRDPETRATRGGAELGAGCSGGGERPEVVVGESGSLRCRRGRRRRRCSARASY